MRRPEGAAGSRSGALDFRDRYEEEGRTVRRYDNASFWDARYHQQRFTHISGRLRPLLTGASRFLDVGCGSGEYVALGREAGVSSVYGADLSFAYCLRTTELASARTVAQASADRLPIASTSVDVVLCSEVLEHLPTKQSQAAIEELCRVASDSVVVTTPNGAAAVRRIARRLNPRAVRELDAEVGHINVAGIDEWARALGSVPGWRIAHLESVHVLPPVIGERLRLPRAVAPVVGWIERTMTRAFPRIGNCLVAVLERSERRLVP